ncbi:MAG: hypothetical protein H6R12_1269 [Proteobacteria bacterium]|nr:hypothetical protein [Pseudomonadota bacterium]
MGKWPLGTVAAVLVAAALPAAAGGRAYDAGVSARQQRQQERISHGVRSGDLTRHEAQWLESGQRWIRRKENLYRSDGVLTEAERRDLRRDLDTSDRNIGIRLHDAERRD